MSVRIPMRLVSFNQRVGALYKKRLRQLEGESRNRHEYRFKAALARAEFDQILCQKDMRIAKQMLLDKEEELRNKLTIKPIYFPTEEKGIAFEREYLVLDWVLDYWHPLEKAVYPEYFARREIRKQQFLEMWEKKHGPPKPCDDH